MPRISAFITAIRKRPEYERRILAVTAYLSGCAIVLALGAASIGQTLSSGGSADVTSAVPGRTSAEAPVDTSVHASAPVGPLQALKEAFSAAVSGSKDLIAELGRVETFVAGSAEFPPPPRTSASADPAGSGTANRPENTATPPPAPRASLMALPDEKKSAARPITAAPTGPAKTILAAVTLPFYSSYATARLLAAPLEAKSRPAVPELNKKTSYISEVVSYNLGELRRTAKDVYYYFAE